MHYALGPVKIPNRNKKKKNETSYTTYLCQTCGSETISRCRYKIHIGNPNGFFSKTYKLTENRVKHWYFSPSLFSPNLTETRLIFFTLQS